MLIFIVFLLISIIAHELGHLITARLCGVTVEAFSVGFFKPYLHFKWKGIDWRFTPWLLGGYCKMAGEKDKRPDGFLAQIYRKKIAIALAGVAVNLIIAFICYLINYKNIFVGIYIDMELAKACFTGVITEQLSNLLVFYKPNMLILELGLINFLCFLTNIIPYPALDGSFLFLPWLEYLWKDKFIKRFNYIMLFGFVSLMVFQIVFILLCWRIYAFS